MRFKLDSTLKIHCWGGFGSQLYALSIALDLMARFKNRQVLIVFHNGGVTLREPEILSLLREIPFEVIEDFKGGGHPAKTQPFQQFSIKFILVRMLTLCGLIARGNTDSEFKKIKPWVRSLRGHYSYRQQSAQTIQSIFERHLEKLPTKKNFVGIQYRLGDLTQLESKSPIDSHEIAKAFFNVPDQIQEVRVYSDSVLEALSRLSFAGIKGIGVEADSLETILDLFSARYFIGTSSKISFWVVILRCFQGNGSGVFMHDSNRKQLELNLGNEFANRIFFY